MAIRVMRFARRLRPHVVDPWTLGMVVAAFAVGVFVISWHSESLKLDVDGTNLAWVILVAFGITYHGDWGTAWRVAAGLLAGSLGALAGMYASMVVLPVTALGVAIGLGVTALGVALITHLVPRIFSFAGAAAGVGLGIAAARSFPIRPTTAADDLFTLMFTMALAIVVGAFGSVALRAAMVWMGMHSHDELGRMRFRRRKPASAGRRAASVAAPAKVKPRPAPRARTRPVAKRSPAPRSAVRRKEPSSPAPPPEPLRAEERPPPAPDVQGEAKTIEFAHSVETNGRSRRKVRAGR